MKLPADHACEKNKGFGGFGRRYMQRLGWEKGEGLGKHKQGIADAVKVKVKDDTVGVGGNATYDWSNKWWESAFEDASKSIVVARESEDDDDASSDDDDRPAQAAPATADDGEDDVSTAADGGDEGDDDDDDDDAASHTGPPAGWWGERVFQFAGLLSMKRGGVRRLRTKRGFTEADQENLAKQTAAAARGRNAGRGGLGRGGGESGAGELKAKEYAGTKVKFDADGDAPPPPAKRGKCDTPTPAQAACSMPKLEKWRAAARAILHASKKGHARGKGVRLDWLETRLAKAAPDAACGEKLAKKLRKSKSFDVLDAADGTRVRVRDA